MNARDPRTLETPPQRAGWALAITSVAFFMVALDTLVVQTALPSIHRDLGGGISVLAWAMNGYLLALAAGVVTAAAIGDRYGRRRTFASGLALFTIASAICAVSPNLEILIGARALQGLGAAAVSPLSLAILSSSFPASRRGAIIGIWMGVAGVAVASGPLISGALTQSLNWHWIFWVNVPIGIGVAFLATTRLVESHGAPTRVDPPGVALVALGAVMVSWAFIHVADAGWFNAEVIGGLIVGIALLVAFVRWESRATEPMMPVRMFRNSSFTAAIGTNFLMNASNFSSFFLISQYFQFGLGYSPFTTGLRVLPLTLTLAFVAPVAGHIADAVGVRAVLIGGLLVDALGLILIVITARDGSAYIQMAVALLLLGVGASMAVATAPAATMNATDPADIGKAAGVLNTLQNFGAVFGIAVVSAALVAGGPIGSAAAMTSGFAPALSLSAALELLAVTTALTMRARFAAPGIEDAA